MQTNTCTPCLHWVGNACELNYPGRPGPRCPAFLVSDDPAQDQPPQPRRGAASRILSGVRRIGLRIGRAAE